MMFIASTSYAPPLSLALRYYIADTSGRTKQINITAEIEAEI